MDEWLHPTNKLWNVITCPYLRYIMVVKDARFCNTLIFLVIWHAFVGVYILELNVFQLVQTLWPSFKLYQSVLRQNQNGTWVLEGHPLVFFLFIHAAWYVITLSVVVFTVWEDKINGSGAIRVSELHVWILLSRKTNSINGTEKYTHTTDRSNAVNGRYRSEF